MTITEFFKAYDVVSIHFKANPMSDHGVSWLPLGAQDISDEDWEDANEEIIDLLWGDNPMTDSSFDFMCGTITYDDGVLNLSGAQTREVDFLRTV